MTTEALLVVLQLADGLFPAGGFAHSFGLETYAQDGRVSDRDGLEAFVVAHLEGAAGPADAVAVAAAVRAAVDADQAVWFEIDGRLEAMKTVPEFRAGSRQMGRQTARVAGAVAHDPFLATLARAIEDGLTPGHHAAVFGAALGRHGVDPKPQPRRSSIRRRRCWSARGYDSSRSASSTARKCWPRCSRGWRGWRPRPR
jgi:urease accessory protein